MPSRLHRAALHRKALAGAAVLLALGVGISTVPADAVAPSTTPAAKVTAAKDLVTWPSGAYSGISIQETSEFGTFRNRPVATTTQFQPSGTRSDMANVDYLAQNHRGRSGILLSTAFWPQNEQGSLALAAKGAYDGIYKQLATNLVGKGMGGITLRPGWEFNGDWMPWRVLTPTDAYNFRVTWARYVTAMRSIPGARFKFDWAPVAINGLQNPALAWPGTKYVNFVGMSVYNYTPNALSTAPAKRFQQLKTWRYGLNWQVNFAKTKKLRVTYPEWGQINRPFNPTVSSGDDSYFILAMWYWFRAVKPAYEMYFDVDTVDFTFYGIATGSGQNPKSSAMYKKLWAKPF